MSSDAGASDAKAPGRLIVISGPSGAGKTSICRALLRRLPDAVWSVSVTTRAPRPGEIDGESYRFVSREEFSQLVDRGELLEHAEYVGERYGTPKAPILAAIERGCCVVLEIDVQGGMQVARRMPDSVRLFVLPPDRHSLRARLEGRNTELVTQLNRRLAEADGEIAVARDSGCYRHFVVNDVLDETIEEVLRIVQQESSSV